MTIVFQRVLEKFCLPLRRRAIWAKTAERYRELVEGQIIPHLGNIVLQKLRPARIKDWHEQILKSGSRKGKPLSPQTVGHAHRVLHRALERAIETELLSRNVAGVISPPKVTKTKVPILTADQIADTLKKLDGHPLFPLAVTGLATGMRRGEILGNL